MQDEIVMLKTGERISEVISAELSDRLNGEMVLDIRTAMKRITAPSVKDRIQFMGQVFNVVSVERTIANGAFLIDISAEHASFSLADEEFDFEEFKYEGSASGALTRILSGTGFDGSVEVSIDSSVFFNRTGAVNRRTLLMDLCSMTGGELEYSGYTIRIAAHRGSAARYVINRRYPVADFTAAETESAVSYEMTTDRADGISVGDNVTIQLTEPFHVEADVRVIGITYNPFYRKTAVIQMGDYRQDIISDIVDDKEDTDDLWESLKDYLKLDDVSTSIGAYIDSEDGSKKIEEALSGTYQTIDGMGNYVQTVNLNTSIAQYIDTDAGTAKIVAAAKGTYQTISGMGNYVKTANLNTSIGQYIDTFAGTAKIVSAASGTYQTIEGMRDYAKVSAVTSVEQSVSNVEAAITLSSVYNKNTIGTNVYALLQLVSNANSSSIKIKADKLDFTGLSTFLTANDLGKNGKTTIYGGRIDTEDLYLKQLRASNGDYIVDYIGNILTIGGGIYNYETAWAEFDYIDMAAKKAVRVGFSSYVCMIAFENYGVSIRPSDSYGKVYIGTESYPVTSVYSDKVYSDYVYCDYLYIDGKKFSLADILKETGINKIYASGSTSDYIGVNSNKAFLPSKSGFELGSTLYPFDAVYIGGTYYWKITNSAILPSSTSTSYFDIGSSSYPVNNVYVRTLYIGGTKLDLSGYLKSTNFAGSNVNMGGTTSNYIVADTNCQLRPSTSSSYYPCYLGTSSFYWHYAYIGSTKTVIGSSSSSYLGFFGSTGSTRQTVSNSATVADLISALKKYGLIY